MDTLVYQHYLLQNKEIPFNKKIKLIEYFFDAYHIYNASEADIKNSRILTPKELDNFLMDRNHTDIFKIYDEYRETPFDFITVEMDSYPDSLRELVDRPYGFFFTGSLPDFKKSVSIVGARRCSEYGKKIAFELAEALSENGYTIVSGMASGIDSYAHRGCLNGYSPTVAVLGCGVDVVYPKENYRLYEQITKQGAIISEYRIGTNPQPKFFPQRNRIVSGLSNALIVVEAREKSGSLITADCALEQGKDIYVVPGRVGDSLSEGCNKLINQGAGIIISVEKFVKDLTEYNNGIYVQINNMKSKSVTLSEKQMIVLGMFDQYPKSLAEVQAKSGIDYLELIGLVMSLVKMGMLAEVFKNHFVICG